MQIARVETFPLLYRLRTPYGDANGYKKYRSCFLIRVITQSGIEGWGEAVDWLPTLEKGFSERIIPYLLGKRATDRLSLVSTISKWHQRSAAAVSMALTEIVAKKAGLSLCELWGGAFHEEIPIYASFQSYTDREDWPLHSVRLVEAQVLAGFRQVKVKVGGRCWQEDRKHIERLMASIPDNVQVALDANQSYDLAESRKWEQVFSRYGNWLWMEEPMPMSRADEYEKLRPLLSVPLAGGENLIKPEQFIPLLKKGAVDLIQPDPMHAEGIDRYRANIDLARSFGHRVSPHVYDGSLARLYAICAQACLPAWSKMKGEAVEPVEWDVMENPFTYLFPLDHQKGRVRVPTGAGIGVEPDWNIIRTLRWDGSAYV
ncbi:mandelate racemase/muconate lactonizing enzyme family protein [Brevibacillus composti]|uniref:Mandelate racemase/muconate lactonizing enzyme family protein n=1 Tax=Brevibacillus composti TaxID=2796470 RepID=A0A7T5ENL3_9BACL|nr:mandelate racemase/muconate lactonizing enzyme family protein [Brevibacillus composti]QQE75919.1 mandelate racemase/muconate lactonizing enzyme family protein [Brevibacillus composti]QUO42945.1 mandelate racemase/muconate lactonizing enzyme family protein [Brevibacillus composti]